MEQLIGEISHYFGNIHVAGIVLSGKLEVGDTVHIVGHTTDFEQAIASMQLDHASIESAGPGDDIGVIVDDKVREHDKVFKVTE